VKVNESAENEIGILFGKAERTGTFKSDLLKNLTFTITYSKWYCPKAWYIKTGST